MSSDLSFQALCYSENCQDIQDQQVPQNVHTLESAVNYCNIVPRRNTNYRIVSSEIGSNIDEVVLDGKALYISPNKKYFSGKETDTPEFIRPSYTREYASTTGEKFVVSHVVPVANTHNEGVKKRKRTRTAFTDAQIKRLEEEYASNRYLDQYRRQNIARSQNLSERTVKIWFQNRRMKEKKTTREANEQSGSEDSQTVNLEREYYAVSAGVFTSPQPITSYGVPPTFNSLTPSYCYGYGQCPSYAETVRLYPSTSQQCTIEMPNNLNHVNVGYKGQIKNLDNLLPSSVGHSNQIIGWPQRKG